jgi:hypothetical protein
MKSIKLLISVVLFVSSLLIHAQDKSCKISIQKGFMHGANIYKGEVPAAGAEGGNQGWNYGVDISHFFSKHFFVATHFTYGEDKYRTNKLDYLSETFYRADSKGDATKKLTTIGLAAGYCQPLTRFANVSGQVGFAYFIHIDQYPEIVYIPDKTYLATEFREQTDLHDQDFLSASFPVKFNIEFTPFKSIPNIGIGYSFGWDVQPDYGFFTGVYHGPQVSFSSNPNLNKYSFLWRSRPSQEEYSSYFQPITPSPKPDHAPESAADHNTNPPPSGWQCGMFSPPASASSASYREAKHYGLSVAYS